MKFRRLALRNIQGNWHQYIAFFLSSVFSVMVFFMFASFIYHPGVEHGTIRAADKVKQGLVACEYVIIIFSFFFVLYSNSAFLKSRKKEFGLFALFGMTNRQINRMVFYENTILALFAIAAGMGLGALFSKLFFMAMSRLLRVDNPIPFQLPLKAVLTTSIGFFLLFQVITVFSLTGINRSQIIELIRAAKKPKSLPTFSWKLVLLSVACLAGGYALAFWANGGTVVVFMLPILFLVILGTYFLFTQASVAVFRKLRNMPSVFYRHTNLITIAQLIFKMKDNARILFMVSILSAVVMTASGTLYAFFQVAIGQITVQMPQTIGFIERGLNSHEVIAPEKLKRILEEDGVVVDYEARIAGVPVQVDLKPLRRKDAQALAVSADDYNRIAERLKLPKLQVERDHAVFLHPYRGMGGTFFSKGETVETTLGGRNLTLHMDGELTQPIVMPLGEATYMVILNGDQHREWMSGVPDDKKTVVYGYELRNWTRTADTVMKIEQAIPQDKLRFFDSRVQPYLDLMQVNSLTLFIGIFVSLLFFIAAGSMIYFKLFTELQEDQAQFRALTRIGITDKEIRKITTTQIGLIFYIPFFVGAVHALFAFKTLGNMLFSSVWKYGFTVIAIFFVMQTAYFLLTRRAYLRRML